MQAPHRARMVQVIFSGPLALRSEPLGDSKSFRRLCLLKGGSLGKPKQGVIAFDMKVSEIKDILKATLLSGEGQLDRKIISGGAADRMEEILSGVAEGSVLLTGLTTIDVIRTAKISGVGAVVIVRGKKPPDEVVALAKSYDLPLLLTSYTLFASVGRLYMNGLRSYDGSW